MKILLIGPQGSGKSTQGKLLAEHLQIPYISTGDIFRRIASEESDLGRKIKQTIESGQLVDDQTTAILVKRTIENLGHQNGFTSRSEANPEHSEGFILDGYPRNLEQANLVPNLNFDKVLYINIPEQEAIDRLLKRSRADDTEDSIRLRLSQYQQQTRPLLDYYKNLEVLEEVSGLGDIQTVQDEIKKSL